MALRTHRWVIILAAGDGTRLRSFTGRSIPKQFYALRGKRSMLRQTLDRARRMVPAEKIMVVVAAQHRHWWQQELKDLPLTNVLVQPRNRGTAAGVLLPLLLIHARDPEAEVEIMPSNHFAERGDLFSSALDEALFEASQPGGRIVLLGVTPERAESHCGWIVPTETRESGSLTRVTSMVDKPDQSLAHDLMASGALINTSLLAAQSRSLLTLYHRQPHLLKAFRSIVGDRVTGPPERGALARLYIGMPTLDFSRDLLQSAGELWVLPVPSCGWIDLGKPVGVTTCLGRSEGPGLTKASDRQAALNLTEVCDELSRFAEMV